MKVVMIMIIIGFVAIVAVNSYSVYNERVDQTGNLNVNMFNDQGTGTVVQNSNGNEDLNKFLNSINGINNDAITEDNTMAGNQEASLINDNSNYGVNQTHNGNNDADVIENHVTNNGAVNSINNFNIANTLARAKSTHGNATERQVNNNNNASNVFTNV